MPTDAVVAGDSAEGGALGAPGLFAGGGGGSGGGAGGGTTGGFGPGSGGQGAVRPLHLVVPRIPREVDERRARGRTVRLLLEVLPDGTVGDLQVEAGSQISALDSAAVKAARQLRYSPPADEGILTSVWTRAVMRF
jgi:TonB family protein